jgi:hypothetical protein
MDGVTRKLLGAGGGFGEAGILRFRAAAAWQRAAGGAMRMA